MNSKITGIIVASGYSGRMGSFKPLLQYENMSFISGLVLKLGLVCDSVSVVVGHKKELIESEIELSFDSLLNTKSEKLLKFICDTKSKTHFIFNEMYDQGMFTSLLKGLNDGKQNDWYLYHFVDQPGLPIKFYFDFVDQVDLTFPWIQPVYKGKSSHPIIFSNEIKELILKANKNESLKDISRKVHLSKKFWECGYEQVLLDIDTAEDYKALLKTESVFLINQLMNHLVKS